MEDFKHGCRLIAKGKKEGRLFELDAGILELNSVMFSKSNGIMQDIDMWQKRIGHVNIQRLKNMQVKGVVGGLPRLKNMQVKGIVGGLPRFKYDGSYHVCEAC